MTEQTGVEWGWPTCKEVGCIGVRLTSAGMCLAHAGEEETAAALKLVGDSGIIDARGVPITSTLLERILTAAPRGENGKPLIKGCCFDGATFSGNAVFTETTFSGHAEFRRVTFKRNARFDKATFERAAFGLAAFSGGAVFTEAAFSGDAVFARATFEHAVFAGAVFKRAAEFGHDAVRPSPRQPGPARHVYRRRVYRGCRQVAPHRQTAPPGGNGDRAELATVRLSNSQS